MPINNTKFKKYLLGNEHAEDKYDEIGSHGFGLSLGHMDDDDTDAIDFSNVDDFAFGTNASGHLSQRSNQMENLVTTVAPKTVSIVPGDNLWNLCQSTLGTLKTYAQKTEFESTMRQLSAKNIAENNPQLRKGASGMTMLGSDSSGNVDSGKRHRMAYEK